MSCGLPRRPNLFPDEKCRKFPSSQWGLDSRVWRSVTFWTKSVHVGFAMAQHLCPPPHALLSGNNAQVPSTAFMPWSQGQLIPGTRDARHNKNNTPRAKTPRYHRHASLIYGSTRHLRRLFSSLLTMPVGHQSLPTNGFHSLPKLKPGTQEHTVPSRR